MNNFYLMFGKMNIFYTSFANFHSVAILLFVSVISYVNCNHISKEVYIQGSGEITEVNEVESSSSKEQFDKVYSRRVEKNKSKTSNYDESPELTMTIPPPQENHCADKKNHNEEGGRCRNTLVNYPYSASIQKRFSHYASGALIDSQHVLTVAAEFYNVRETKKLFRVRLGSVDCKRSGVVVPIKSISIHPSFVPGSPSFDLGLLLLASPVGTTEFIKPVPLSRVQQGVLSAMFLVTYWPRLIIRGKSLPETANERQESNTMRVSTQQLIPWKTCADMMKARDVFLDETSLCLEPIEMYHSICMPDVGAPVVADDSLWGVTSGWTFRRCSKSPSPTIVTRTSSKLVRDWLNKSIENEAVAKTEIL